MKEIKPYTIKEIETLYGKSAGRVIWEMRQQQWPVKVNASKLFVK